eukprot:TRINITY_DN14708_c0_g1_i4.p1 TRINITY_DN14708_c0_g1~~TRINITY_DN14708_c0_g1_i4.p1  ORF type:complete len:550 (+),score=192.95 TRINITY_DN14708_c0_g1_i4:61-1650(+)
MSAASERMHGTPSDLPMPGSPSSPPPAEHASVDSASFRRGSRRTSGRAPTARPDFAEMPAAPPAPPPAAPEIEPEPSLEPGSDYYGDFGDDVTGLGERGADLESAIADAAAQQNYARAWRLQEERARVLRLRSKLETLDAEVQSALLQQKDAAAQGDYLRAQMLQERVGLHRRERAAEGQCERRILQLELQLLEISTDRPTEADAQELLQDQAAQIRAEVEALRAARRVEAEVDARRTDLRMRAKQAAAAEDYATAARLKEEEEALLDRDVSTAQLHHSVTTASRQTQAASPALPHALWPQRWRPDGGIPQITGADSLGPLYTPLMPSPPRGRGGAQHGAAARPPAAAGSHPDAVACQTGAAAQLPGVGPKSVRRDVGQDVASQLAALIWDNAHSSTSAPQQQPQLQPQLHAAQQQLHATQQFARQPELTAHGSLQPAPPDHGTRLRLMSFYQYYNPAKLPSVARCLREYRGHEEKLFGVLVRKYGPEPPDQLAGPLLPGWRLVESSSGDCFYLHDDGRKQWERPAALH